MKRVGIIGCGAIGTGIAEFIHRRLKKKARIVAICDIDSKKAEELARKIKPRPLISDIDTLIKKSDFIIEAAGVSVSGSVAEKAILHKRDALIMSTGGLLRKASLLSKASMRGSNIYIASGAICGLDGLAAAALGQIKSVTLTTRKPPNALRGSPFLKKRGIDIDNINKETLIYSGTAEAAVKYFPQNINVAATLSLTGIGPKATKVRIVTSPAYTRNIHEVEIEGEFGRIFTRTENIPSRRNPKTSQLAIFSALAKLKEVLI